MSVTCLLHAATDAEVEQLVADPSLIHDFLEPRGHQPPGCFAFWRNAPVVAPRPSCDVGKSWEAIHYVLTGSKGETSLPRGFLVAGGRYIGDEEVGLEPARAFRPAEVAEIVKSLRPTTDFRARIHVAEMNRERVYGAPLPGDPVGVDLLVADYDRVSQFISERAALGEALVIQMV